MRLGMQCCCVEVRMMASATVYALPAFYARGGAADPLLSAKLTPVTWRMLLAFTFGFVHFSLMVLGMKHSEVSSTELLSKLKGYSLGAASTVVRFGNR